MASPLRNKIRALASLALIEPQHVKIWYSVHGDERKAYRFARSIIQAFANMRQWERKQSDKRQMMADEPRLLRTTYEDISVRIVPFGDRYEVHFVKEEHEDWSALFDDGHGAHPKIVRGEYAEHTKALDEFADISDEELMKGFGNGV